MIKKKLQKNIGESLIETLAALLIAALGLTLLPGAIVAAARVNNKAETASFSPDGAVTDLGSSFEIKVGTETQTVRVNVYKKASGEYYYEKTP